MLKQTVAVLILGWLACPFLWGEEKSGTSKKGLQLVRDHLQALKAPEAAVEPVQDYVLVYKDSKDTHSLATVFPEHAFVSVRFPLWPVAIAPPEPLKSRNIFAVDKEDKLTHLTGPKDLEAFFKKHARLVGAEKHEKSEVRKNNIREYICSWLRLTQEFVQDGFFKFYIYRGSPGIMQSGGKESNRWLVGTLSVVPEAGNKGSLQVSIFIDDKGKIEKFVESNKIVAGIRPRCQATHLLHADPVIRAICEQDLLVLGRAAQPYLQRQRAQATPELQRAIDRIWERILREDR